MLFDLLQTIWQKQRLDHKHDATLKYQSIAQEFLIAKAKRQEQYHAKD